MVGRKIGETATRLDRVQKLIPEMEKAFAAQGRESLEAARGKVIGAVEEKVGALAAVLVESDRKVKDFSTYITRLEAREEQTEKERIAGLAKALDAFEADLRGRLSAAAHKGETLEDEVFTRLSSRIQANENTLATSIETIELRLADYQGDVDYRVKVLEDANHDVDALRTSLVQTMDKMAGSMRTEMKGTAEKLAAELMAGWKSEVAGAEATREKLHASMGQLAAELEELKARAYQDAEKQLSAFEEEFFSDLRARSTLTQQKFQAWQAEIEKRAETFEAAVRERAAGFEAGVRERAAGFEAGVREHAASFEAELEARAAEVGADVNARVESLAAGVTARTEAARESVLALQNALGQMMDRMTAGMRVEMNGFAEKLTTGWKSEVEGASAARERLRVEMAELQAAVEDLRARAHADAEKKLAAFQEELLTDLRARSTLTQTKFQAWQAEMEKRTAGFEADITQRTAAAGDSVQTLRETLRGDIEKARKDASTSFEKDLGGVRELMETGTRKMHAQIEARLEEMSREVETGRRDLAELFESSRAEIAAWEEGAKKQLADAELGNAGRLSSLSSRIEADKAALAKSIETVESRLADYQGDVDYRMKVLDEANRDVDALRASLSQTADKMGAAVRAEMKGLTDQLAAELTNGWKSEVAGAEATRQQLQASMGELQAELEVLKKRAYQDAEKKLSMFEEEFFADLRARSTLTQEKFQSWQAEMEKRAAGFEAGVRERAASLEAVVKARAASVEADVNARVESLEADVKTRAAAAGESVQALREALSGDIERARNEASLSFEKNLGGVRDTMEAESRKMHREIEARLEALSAELSAGRKDLADLFESSRAEIAAWEDGAKAQLAEAERENAGRLTNLASRIQSDEAALAKNIETVELRLADYQGDVDYRVKVLEDAHRDVDALRTSLTQTMDKMAEGVRAEMKGLAEELAAGWKSDIAGAAIAREQLQAGMGELEAGLEELKARAYQDAEKKLSVFEEEFFTDLRARSTMTQEKFQAWQVEMEKRAASFEADVKERTSAADEAVQTLREALRADVEKARKDASLSFEKDLGGVKDVMEAATRKMHREIESRLKELAVELNAGRKELTELFEASRTEIATWEGGAKKQLAEAELAIAEKISSLSAEASSSVSAIRDAFAAQKEDLLVSTNEERIGLRKELAQMGETISSFEADLKKTTEAAMEALRTQMDGFQLESQKRVREVQSGGRGKNQGAKAAPGGYQGESGCHAGKALREDRGKLPASLGEPRGDRQAGEELHCPRRVSSSARTP